MLKRFSFSAMSCHVMPTTLTPSPHFYKDKQFWTGKFSKINVNNSKMNISLK